MKILINDKKILLPIPRSMLNGIFFTKELKFKQKRKVVKELKRFAKNNKGFEFIRIETKDNELIRIIL